MKLIASYDDEVVGTRNSKREYRAVVIALVDGREPKVWSWHGNLAAARMNMSSENSHDWTGTGYEGVRFVTSDDVRTA